MNNEWTRHAGLKLLPLGRANQVINVLALPYQKIPKVIEISII